MSTKKLNDYFHGQDLRRALQAYAINAVGPGWSVWHKSDLYEAALIAYERPPSQTTRAAFQRIYDALSSQDWGAFRPHGKQRCWPPDKIYNTIRSCMRPFAPLAKIDLCSFAPKYRPATIEAMGCLGGMKPNRHYPTMATSKFLHFFNPSLFPIWDNKVVDQMVFARFGSDYDHFCLGAGLNAKATGAEFLTKGLTKNNLYNFS